jgi:hypothetical protein
VRERVKEIADLRTAYDAVADAVRTLAAKPKDPEANLALGKFYALEKGDWERGLPLLAQGSDSKLKALVQGEATVKRDSTELQALGDRYVALADSESGAAKANLRRRAGYWYLRARSAFVGQDSSEWMKKIGDFENTLPPNRPVVLYAVYVASKSWVDFTDILRFRLQQNYRPKTALKIVPEELGPDPDPGNEKMVVVVYRYQGCVNMDYVRLRPEKQGEAPSVFYFGPSWGQVNFDPDHRGPGQDLLILDGKLCGGGETNWLGHKPQSLVKGATLKAKPSDFASIGPQERNKAFVLIYHDGKRVRLSITPTTQDISIDVNRDSAGR